MDYEAILLTTDGEGKTAKREALEAIKRESYEAGLEAAAVQVSIYKIGNPRTPREQAKAIRALKSKNGGE